MTLRFGSLFSGIGGFDLGFECAGLECAWQVEIDGACQDVEHRHWPDVKRFGDVRNVGKSNLDSVDVIAGGFPCQDLSVAGKRAGLAGKRSGLWYEFHRILAELKPQWVVIENVPGLLSSCGCDECCAVRRILRVHSWLRKRRGVVKCAICSAGERMLKSHRGRDFATILRGLVELRYGVTWRILDAQFFGVPQRRRRVFVVGSLGDGRAAQVLFEREGGAGDTPPRQEAGARVAGTIAAGAHPGGCNGRDVESDLLIPLELHGGSKRKDRPNGGFYVREMETVKPLDTSGLNPNCAQGGNMVLTYSTNGIENWREGIGALPERNGKDAGNGIVVNVAHTLRAEADASEDGTGRGTPLVAFDYCLQGSERTWIHRGDGYAQLQATRPDAVAGNFGVRRLTPVECERLQGFPDGWTEWGIDESGERVNQSDSTRYRQLGNAVCESVAEWIGRRLAAEQ